MKKKFIFIFILVVSLFVPKNILAKTLELNLPSNYVSDAELGFAFSVREFSLFLEFLDINYDRINEVSPSEYFGLERNDDKFKFYKLPGVEVDELIIPITEELKQEAIHLSRLGFFDGYDSIKCTLKEIEVPAIPKDYTIDLSKRVNIFDMKAGDFILLELSMMFAYNSRDLPFTVLLDDDHTILEMYSLNNKKLFSIMSDVTGFENLFVISDDVTYKDNISFEFDDELKNYFRRSGYNFNIDKLNIIFVHEPMPENESKPVNDKIKNIIKNPETSNDLLILLFVCICSIVGGVLVKKMKNT